MPAPCHPLDAPAPAGEPLASVLLWALAAFAPPLAAQVAPGAADLHKLEQHERDATARLFDQCYEAGKSYYQNGYRREAIWFLRRCNELRPRLYALQRFVDLLQDYDNPIWRRKKWKSPKTTIDEPFRRKAAALDQKYVAVLVDVGDFCARDRSGVLRKEGRERYTKALQLAGGPFEVDADGRLIVAKGVTIPAASSAAILAEDIATINGLRYLRDSMLRSLKNVSEVYEARGAQFFVRTVTSKERAEALVPLMEQAARAYRAHTGQQTDRALGVFAFADKDSFQNYCRTTPRFNRFVEATGFANNGEGFAVTFEHAALEKTAVHEGAHLFHAAVFQSSMPSWYDEGFACFFGHQHSMRWDGKTLVTMLPPARAAFADLIDQPGRRLPLRDLLSGDAGARLAANDGSAETFYLQSWALYTFLETTLDPRFRDRFEDWESFCLGSGYEHGQQASAAQLFDRIFGDVLADLEPALWEWLAQRP